jgi:hypothetical protein
MVPVGMDNERRDEQGNFLDQAAQHGCFSRIDRNFRQMAKLPRGGIGVNQGWEYGPARRVRGKKLRRARVSAP